MTKDKFACLDALNTDTLRAVVREVIEQRDAARNARDDYQLRVLAVTQERDAARTDATNWETQANGYAQEAIMRGNESETLRAELRKSIANELALGTDLAYWRNKYAQCASPEQTTALREELTAARDSCDAWCEQCGQEQTLALQFAAERDAARKELAQLQEIAEGHTEMQARAESERDAAYVALRLITECDASRWLHSDASCANAMRDIARAALKVTK